VHGRRDHETNWCAIAVVRVGFEDEIGYPGRAVGIERLLATRGVDSGRIEFVPMAVIGLPLSSGV